MFVVCQNSKYGYRKYGKKCDKIHFTDVCEINENCGKKYCDKRHPFRCHFFDKFGRCKFGTFCSYWHTVNVLEREVSKLPKEISVFKCDNNKLQEKISALKTNRNETCKNSNKQKENEISNGWYGMVWYWYDPSNIDKTK